MLRGWPALRRFYFQTRYLMQIVREKYLTDPVAMNDRSHLEHEWDFSSGPDRDRWRRVLELVAMARGPDWGDVLEAGCAEGLGTKEIARYAGSLVAGDISPVARERVARRLQGVGHVSVVELDVRKTRLGTHDVVFAMDVLEFVHGRRSVLRTVDRLAAAVRPGGLLVVSMCRYDPVLRSAWWQTWIPEGADRILPLIGRHPALELLHQEPHPTDGQPIPGYMDHLIALFGKR